MRDPRSPQWFTIAILFAFAVSLLARPAAPAPNWPKFIEFATLFESAARRDQSKRVGECDASIVMAVGLRHWEDREQVLSLGGHGFSRAVTAVSAARL